MRRKPSDNPNSRLALLVLGAFILAVIAAAVTLWHGKQPETLPEAQTGPVTAPIPENQVITYEEAGKEAPSKEITAQRKSQFGMDKGVDLIVKADESVKIGDTTISMQEILKHIQLKKGDIVEKNVGNAVPEPSPAAGHHGNAAPYANAYGIYVVQPLDNIWNVHFQFLRDYFKQRGIALSLVSDEPNRRGFSSGVGKILKFSENMVYIYNLRERKLDVDLDTIQPLTKIVIFDMGRVFTLLDQIDDKRIDHIQFDGETLWIPAQ
ncbi:MAG: hypothetical protein RBT11_18095 [Desulfobacterales bacterium]|jgi:hypothetical protein|nr:hypothetical protein [Desulfobacterales bacterium]